MRNSKLTHIAILSVLGFFLSINALRADFIPNQGQWPDKVLAYTSFNTGRIYIEKTGLTYVLFDPIDLASRHSRENGYDGLKGHVYHVSFLGGRANPILVAGDQNSYFHNYFIGNDEGKWQSAVPSLKSITINGIYPGIDLKFYENEYGLKYDFILEAGANPDLIQMEYQHADSVELDRSGNLAVSTSVQTVFEHKPIAFSFGAKGDVNCIFTLEASILSFSFPDGFDKTKRLRIDPSLSFATYSGAREDNWGFTATNDRFGNAYAAGNIIGSAYPGIMGAFDPSFNGSIGTDDVLIAKFDASGRNLLYYTYLGGTNVADPPTHLQNERGLDNPMSILVDGNDHLLVLGKTVTSNFPTRTPYQSTHKGGTYDLFVSKFSANGQQLLASTYIGGNEDDGHNAFTSNPYVNFGPNSLNYNYGDYSRSEIVTDSMNNYFIASNTKSTNFPVSGAAYERSHQGNQDAVVFKLSSNLKTLMWSTYFGGSSNDAAYGISVDGDGGAYITGGTSSIGLFNSVTSSYRKTAVGSIDGYIAHFDNNGSVLQNGTYIGTPTYDQSYLIQRASNGSIYITGQTEGAFLRTNNVYFEAGGKQFIQRFDSTLSSRTLSTYFGSGKNLGADISPTAFLVDVCERIYVSGWGGATNGGNQNTGGTTNLSVSNDALQSTTDGSDFYLIVLEADAINRLHATFYGGGTSHEHVDGGTSRFDRNGVVYQAVCAGCGGNDDFPTSAGAFSRTNNSVNCNMAVFKVDFQLVQVKARFTASPAYEGCVPFTVNFDNRSTFQPVYLWDFDDNGQTSSTTNPTYTFTKPGTYKVKLIVANCLYADTLEREITVFDIPNGTVLPPDTVCPLETVDLIARGGRFYQWKGDPSIVKAISADTVRVLPKYSRLYTVYINNMPTAGTCADTATIWVPVYDYRGSLKLKDTAICKGESAVIKLGIDSSIIINWNWKTGSGIPPNDLQPLVSPNVTTTYYVDAFTADGCRYVDSVTINVFELKANAGPDRWLCVDDSVSLEASGGLRYLWNTGDRTKKIKVSVLDSAEFWVRTYYGSCISEPDTVKLRVNFINPTMIVNPDTGVAPQWVNFEGKSYGGDTYCWSFGDGEIQIGKNVEHLYYTQGIYKVMMIAKNSVTGCADTLYKDVVMDTVYLEMPNAITLDNNSLNDNFIAAHANMKSIHFQVFNRWGEMVFESHDKDFKWDGTSNGEKVPQGSYVYQLSALGLNELIYKRKGFIAVIW